MCSPPPILGLCLGCGAAAGSNCGSRQTHTTTTLSIPVTATATLPYRSLPDVEDQHDIGMARLLDPAASPSTYTPCPSIVGTVELELIETVQAPQQTCLLSPAEHATNVATSATTPRSAPLLNGYATTASSLATSPTSAPCHERPRVGQILQAIGKRRGN